jgi:hypothetical protein
MVFGIKTTYEHISKKKWKQHKANNFNMILGCSLNFMNLIRKQTKPFNVTKDIHCQLINCKNALQSEKLWWVSSINAPIKRTLI